MNHPGGLLQDLAGNAFHAPSLTVAIFSAILAISMATVGPKVEVGSESEPQLLTGTSTDSDAAAAAAAACWGDAGDSDIDNGNEVLDVVAGSTSSPSDCSSSDSASEADLLCF